MGGVGGASEQLQCKRRPLPRCPLQQCSRGTLKLGPRRDCKGSPMSRPLCEVTQRGGQVPMKEGAQGQGQAGRVGAGEGVGAGVGGHCGRDWLCTHTPRAHRQGPTLPETL